MAWISLTTNWLGEKLNGSICATRAREGCLLSEFRAAIKVNLIKIPCHLTAKTIHIHILYFPTISLFFRDKMKKKLTWLVIDLCWLVTRGWLGLAVGSCNATTHHLKVSLIQRLRVDPFAGQPPQKHRLQNVRRHALRYCWKKKKANGRRPNCLKEQNIASFSKSRPDKLFNSGKLWPIGKHLVFFLINNMRLYSTRLVNGSCSKST